MTYDEAIIAAKLELPVIHTYIDGCSRIEFECKKITQVGYDFIGGKESPFVQLLDRNGGCVYNARLEDVRVKEPADLERWYKKDA